MPAIHTQHRPYSILRAIKGALSITEKVDGLEGEVSAEIRRGFKADRFKGQFSVPVDPEPDLRALMYPGSIRRDLTTSSGAGAIFLEPNLPIIDLLRAKLVLGRLGATFLTDMHGQFGIPRASAQSTTQWLPEGSYATPDTPETDSVTFKPNLAVDITNVSRLYLNSTSVAAEGFILRQAARNIAVEIDRVGINGAGPDSNEPIGLLQNSAILAASSGLAIGDNGGAAGWSNITDLEESVSASNADIGSLGYLASPQLRKTLKNTPKISGGTAGIFCWGDSPDLGVGKMNGYRAEATNNVPSTLTKGTGTDLSALIFGDWESLIVATFKDGIDWLVNPYTNQRSGDIIMSLFMSCDVNVRHEESFRVINDCTTS